METRWLIVCASYVIGGYAWWWGGIPHSKNMGTEGTKHTPHQLYRKPPETDPPTTLTGSSSSRTRKMMMMMRRRGRRRRSDDREERGRSYTRYKNPAQTDNAEKQHQQNPQTQCNDNHDDVDDDDNDSDNSDDDNLMTMMRMKVEHQHTIRPRSSLNRSRKPCKIEGPSHSPLRAWVPKKSTEDLTGGWTWYYQTYKPSGSHPVESC